MIINYLLSAIILGIIVAIPPGSVTIIACQRAIMYGFKNSIFFSIGSCVSDVFYIILVYIGISNLITNNHYLKIVSLVICGLILIFLGILSIISLSNKQKVDSEVIKFQTNLFATFISGILITLTNPMTIVGWIAIAGNYFLIWNEKYPISKNYMIITIFLIMVGVMIWFIPLTFIISKLKKVINEKIKILFITFSNMCLIIFGFIALYYAYTSIKS